MSSRRHRPGPTRPRGAVLLVVLVALTTACGGAAASQAAPEDTSAATTGGTGADVDPADDPSTAEPDEAAADGEPDEDGVTETPEESFRTWLTASREPDLDLACAYLTDELVERMVAEMVADGWPGVTDCASMTRVTAEVYAAFDASAEVSLDVREHTPDRAVLGIRYATGDCGTAVMVPVGTRWVMDERTSEEC